MLRFSIVQKFSFDVYWIILSDWPSNVLNLFSPGTEPEKKKRGRKRKVDTPTKDEEDKKIRQVTVVSTVKYSYYIMIFLIKACIFIDNWDKINPFDIGVAIKKQSVLKRYLYRIIACYYL